MKQVAFLFAAVLLTSAASLCAAEAARPNIVLIFADDLGWKDVGYQGSDFIETPNIDRLASEGMVFTDGLCSRRQLCAEPGLPALGDVHAAASCLCRGKHGSRSQGDAASDPDSQQKRTGERERHVGRRA